VTALQSSYGRELEMLAKSAGISRPVLCRALGVHYSVDSDVWEAIPGLPVKAWLDELKSCLADQRLPASATWLMALGVRSILDGGAHGQ
jgi:hypothetical protein